MLKKTRPKGYVAKQRKRQKKTEPAAGPWPGSSNKMNSSPSTVRCVQVLGAGVPPYNLEKERRTSAI